MNSPLHEWGLNQLKQLSQAAEQTLEIANQQRQDLLDFQAQILRETASFATPSYRYRVVTVPETCGSLMVMRCPVEHEEKMDDPQRHATSPNESDQTVTFQTFQEATLYVNRQRPRRDSLNDR